MSQIGSSRNTTTLSLSSTAKLEGSFGLEIIPLFNNITFVTVFPEFITLKYTRRDTIGRRGDVLLNIILKIPEIVSGAVLRGTTNIGKRSAQKKFMELLLDGSDSTSISISFDPNTATVHKIPH